MTIDALLRDYQSRTQAVQEKTDRVRSESTIAMAALLLAGATFVYYGVEALRHREPAWLPILPAVVAIAAAVRFFRKNDAASRMWRLRRFYGRAMQRVNAEWAEDTEYQTPNGDAFDDASHVFAHDLNILGDGSLFQLLCIARSGIGQRGLAKYLLETPSREETLARQEAVRELLPRADLREQVTLLGSHSFAEAKWETFTDWLASPKVKFPPYIDILFFITPPLLVAVLVASLLQGALLQPWTGILLFLQVAAGILFKERVSEALAGLNLLASEIQVLREGLELLEGQTFQSPKLRELQARVKGSSAAARRLEKLLWLCRERAKDWFFAISHALMVGLQVSIALERWRAQHEAALPVWLEAWSEFEALNALGCYAYENPDDIFPEIFEAGACFEGLGVGHPLLPRDECVRNDVALDAATRFYIISGSNMAGKSTLLRAIGLNAVLAMAGAPVRAKTLRLSPLSVAASLSVVDSLLHGKSKFLAEVERLRQAIDLTAQPRPVLFLIDEIFSGTNSRDRRAAAEAIVRTLIGKGAIGALSTHDLALTEIAHDPALCGINVHMGSRGQGDPMDFDYVLKTGVTQESNALAIARMAGVVT
ncbi:MAG: DNA mismatch repair protein MutS [Acidobacteriota bacterium]